jgi:hypothetical protein
LRDHYSDEPIIRAAALCTEIYNWLVNEEGRIKGEIH